MLAVLLLALTECNPVEDLVFCRNEIRDLSDTLRFVAFQNAEYAHLFKVNGVHVADTLDQLASQLEWNFNDCPCMDTCTQLSECSDTLDPIVILDVDAL